MPLGASRAVEGERIRSSREVDLARTIEAIDAVHTARVHLADERPSVFVRDRAAAAASVMLHAGRRPHAQRRPGPGDRPSGRLLRARPVAGQRFGGRPEWPPPVQHRRRRRRRRLGPAARDPVHGRGPLSPGDHLAADADRRRRQFHRRGPRRRRLLRGRGDPRGFPEGPRTMRAEQGQVTTESGPAAQPAGGIPGALSNTAAARDAAASPDPRHRPSAGAPAGPCGAGKPPQRAYQRSYARRPRSVGHPRTDRHRSPLSVAVAIRNAEGGPPRPATKSRRWSSWSRARSASTRPWRRRRDHRPRLRRDRERAPSWWEAGWVSPMVRNLAALIIALLVVFFFGRRCSRASAALANRASSAGRCARGSAAKSPPRSPTASPRRVDSRLPSP